MSASVLYSLHASWFAKKVKKKKAESTESFHFPDQAVFIAGRRVQMASGLKSAENQLGCVRGHFLLHLPGSPVRGRSRSSEQDKKCQYQDLCLAPRTLGKTGVGLEGGRSEDELLDSCLMKKKNMTAWQKVLGLNAENQEITIFPCVSTSLETEVQWGGHMLWVILDPKRRIFFFLKRNLPLPPNNDAFHRLPTSATVSPNPRFDTGCVRLFWGK